ncbi:MAG: hypothetical protein ACRD40_10850 [Candidatus Acidiferrales bacterium]
MRRRRIKGCKQAIIILSLLTVASCANAKNLTSKDLSSEVLSAISLASETEMFVGQIQQGRLTQEFQYGYAGYLRDEAEREAKDLRTSTPQPAQMQAVRNCIAQLDLLARELDLIKRTDKTRLPAIQKRVQTIVQSLSAVKAQL